MNKKCEMQLLNQVWLIHDQWFTQAISAYRAGDLKPVMQLDADDEERELFTRGPNGMMIIPIQGQITKRFSSFGGASSVKTRQLLRDASTDDSVSGVLLMIDSPGGTAAGTFELAEEVRKFSESKPIRAHIQDLGASAAFWVASQTQKITINQLGETGSIGTVAVLVDSSKAMENHGLKVHVISTGSMKGAGTPGTEVTPEQLAVFQEQVDDFNAFFLQGVSNGRGITGAALTRIASGRVWIAEKAQQLGLVDEIMSFEDAVEQFAGTLDSQSSVGTDLSTSLEMAQLELDISQRSRGS